MTEGVVKWFDKVKGYGFISTSKSSVDIFVHYTCFIDSQTTLTEGDRVIFEIVNGEKGPKAEHLRLAETNRNRKTNPHSSSAPAKCP